jgi:hypothetical protein
MCLFQKMGIDNWASWGLFCKSPALGKSGQTVAAIKFLREETNFSLPLAKEMVEHMYGRILRPLGPPCASCGSPLLTPRAKLCAECGARVDY